MLRAQGGACQGCAHIMMLHALIVVGMGVQAYYLVVCYIMAPFFAFCNAYGMGLTDWNMVTT